jgi:hypothetical protein
MSPRTAPVKSILIGDRVRHLQVARPISLMLSSSSLRPMIVPFVFGVVAM